MPMMPFIGVRISWDMLARKTDFARFAACARSARSRARASDSARRSRISWRRVVSRWAQMKRLSAPSGPWTALSVRSAQ